MSEIKVNNYSDERDQGMRWLDRCIDCGELFLGVKADFICSECDSKPEQKNGDE